MEKAPSSMVVVGHTRSVESFAAGLKEKGLSIKVVHDLDAGLYHKGVSPDNALDLPIFGYGLELIPPHYDPTINLFETMHLTG